jgi:protein-disulfide isomerase
MAQQAAENSRMPAAGGGLSPRVSPSEQEARPLLVSEMGYNQGAATAPLKVIEFTDFGCGYCARFHAEVYPTLKEVYLDGGFIEWKHIAFMIGRFPNAMEAATAGECAGEQDQYFPMHARLFSDQGAWKNQDDPYPALYEIADDIGLDMERFGSCIDGGWRNSRIRDNLRLAQEAGVRGTPTFVIEGQVLPGFLPLSSFRDVLDVALTQRGITPPPRGEADGGSDR